MIVRMMLNGGQQGFDLYEYNQSYDLEGSVQKFKRYPFLLKHVNNYIKKTLYHFF